MPVSSHTPSAMVGVLLVALLGLATPVAGATSRTPAAADAVPVLAAAYGSHARATLRLGALDPALYRVVRRPSPSTVVVHYPATSHCATTTLRLRTVRTRLDPVAWLRANTPPSLAFETTLTATVPTRDGSTLTRVVGGMRLLAGIVNSRVLTERAVTAARLRTGRLAVLSQTSRTIDLVEHPGTPCGGSGTFSTGPAFAELRVGLAASVDRSS